MKSKSTNKKPAIKTIKKPRKKRRAALTVEDGARAALLAAVLVALAVVLSMLLLIFLKPESEASAALDNEAALHQPVQDEPGARSAPERTAPVVRQPPVSVPQQPVPLVRQHPAETPLRLPEQPPYEEPEGRLPLDSAGAPVERTPTPPVPEQRGTLVFVIDDAGNNLHELDAFLAFPGPLTIAVLPALPHSAEAARRIRAAGKEVILHQPMEALGGQNPGPGAIFSDMNPDQILAVLEKNLAEVGPVVGMNNHQGSKITMNEEIMEIILSFCSEKQIYFLDSRTTADSVVPALAARMGIHIRERDVFVDNIQEKAAMIRYIQEGLRKAEKNGTAVMIGHVWSSELAATLEELYPELIEQGFSLSTISRIMMGSIIDEDFGY